MISAIQHALFGMNYHRKMLDDAAYNISRASASYTEGSGPPVDLAQEMVDMLVAKHGFSANVKTIQVADSLIGTLLDTYA